MRNRVERARRLLQPVGGIRYSPSSEEAGKSAQRRPAHQAEPAPGLSQFGVILSRFFYRILLLWKVYQNDDRRNG